MSFIEAIKTCFSKYVCFTGRARRSEYWYFYLFTVIVSTVLVIIQGQKTNALTYIASIALFLPGLGVAVRRMHDVGKSGWYLLMALIPIVGIILVLIQMCTEGTAGPNAYGDDPKDRAPVAVTEPAVQPDPDPVPAAEEEPPVREEYTDVIMETVQKEKEKDGVCPACGAPVKAGEKFCTYCGEKIV